VPEGLCQTDELANFLGNVHAYPSDVKEAR